MLRHSNKLDRQRVGLVSKKQHYLFTAHARACAVGKELLSPRDYSRSATPPTMLSVSESLSVLGTRPQRQPDCCRSHFDHC